MDQQNHACLEWEESAQLAQARRVPDTNPHCGNCPLGTYCLPLGLTQAEISRLERIMRVSRVLPARQRLYYAGEPLKALHVVRSGAFKTAAIDCDGHEQVVGFHLPGELLGLDGIHSGIHRCDAIALGTSRVCVFPFPQLMGLASDVSSLLERLVRLLGKDIAGTMAAIGDYTADERLAAFLLGISLRLPPRGEPKTEFALPMLLTDVANHLRLAGATLSRTLARLEKRGLIRVECRKLRLTDLAGLQDLARRVPDISL
jgi:CRP/FNR family transcriptional regulator